MHDVSFIVYFDSVDNSVVKYKIKVGNKLTYYLIHVENVITKVIDKRKNSGEFRNRSSVTQSTLLSSVWIKYNTLLIQQFFLTISK